MSNWFLFIDTSAPMHCEIYICYQTTSKASGKVLHMRYILTMQAGSHSNINLELKPFDNIDSWSASWHGAWKFPAATNWHKEQLPVFSPRCLRGACRKHLDAICLQWLMSSPGSSPSPCGGLLEGCQMENAGLAPAMGCSTHSFMRVADAAPTNCMRATGT